jgi:hypothetical protein
MDGLLANLHSCRFPAAFFAQLQKVRKIFEDFVRVNLFEFVSNLTNKEPTLLLLRAYQMHL